MVEEDRPQKKKKITIKNKGIVISDNPISNLSNVESTIVSNPTPPVNVVSEPTKNLDMADIPEEPVSVPENIVTEQAVSEPNASVHSVSEQAVPENVISENTFSEQDTSVSVNVNPDHTPTENLISDQPIQSQQQHTSPEKQNPSEQQQQQKSSEPHKSPSPIQTSQQNIFESTAAEENAVFEYTEKVISEATKPLPETSPVFDDFSKTDFFSGISADEIPSSSNRTPENNAQLVSILTENPTPLKTVVDLTMTSDKEDDTDMHSETSSGSSFDADVFVSNLMSRKKRSENRFVIPPRYFPKRTVVDKMLNNFECDLKIWLTNLYNNCSDSYDPVETNLLFTKFRKRFNTAASAIHDVACQSALKNLQDKINRRTLYLEDKPAYESYTAFTDRLAAAKAAEEKARLEAEILIAEQRIKELARIAALKDKATEMDLEKVQNSDVAEMDIDNQQSAEAEVVVAADKELKDAEPEASVDLKAWMAK